MKIIDKYILKSYLTRLLNTFIILMIIFIIQTLWLFIDELAGKGLDTLIIIKFLLYYSPKLFPLVLPLSVLLSSIMTYGTLAENYEFAAMKSTGISLKRAMRTLIVFHILLGIGSFYISNSLIPYSEIKSYNLRRNLAQLKPAIAITEGIFNNINFINIKVDKKHGKNDEFLEKVIIHQRFKNKINRVVIKAKSGELKSKTTEDNLQLVLYNGNRYEEIARQRNQKYNFPHAKVSFEKYIMNIDLSQFNNVNLEEEKYISTFRMQKANQLLKSIDTLERDFEEYNKNYINNFIIKNSTPSLPKIDTTKVKKDTLCYPHPILFLARQKESEKIQIIDRTTIELKRVISNLQNRKIITFNNQKRINLHILVLQDKFALTLTPILLFLIGASIGAIIRKGGIGLPMVFAIVIFLTYYYIGILSKNAAEDGSVDPVLASWISNLIVAPFSYLLLRKVTADSAIFNFIELYSTIKTKFKKNNKQ